MLNFGTAQAGGDGLYDPNDRATTSVHLWGSHAQALSEISRLSRRLSAIELLPLVPRFKFALLIT